MRVVTRHDLRRSCRPHCGRLLPGACSEALDLFEDLRGAGLRRLVETSAAGASPPWLRPKVRVSWDKRPRLLPRWPNIEHHRSEPTSVTISIRRCPNTRRPFLRIG